MTRIIYADLLFIINFLADFIVIYLTGTFSGLGINFIKLLISSIIGAISGTVILSSASPGVAAALYTILSPCLICFITFGKRRLSTFANTVFYFYLSSVLLYGGIYAMASITTLFLHGITIPDGFLFTLIFFGAVALIYVIFNSWINRSINQVKHYVKAELFDGLKTYNLNFLVDTGNMAKDPFSAKPVVIVNANALDSELLYAVCKSLEYDNNLYNNIKPRVIPMKTVSGTALLYAFVPESMYIYIGKKKYKIDCIVAIDQHENAFLGKDGIIPETLLRTV